MNAKDRIKKAYDSAARYYGPYMEHTNHTYAQERIINLLQEEIRGRIIDVGTGNITVTVAQKIPDLEVTATDISVEMVKQAEKNARSAGVRVDFRVDDIEESAFPDKEFDAVICSLGMLWFINKDKALEEMTRICREGGRVLLIEEEGTPLRSEEPRLFGKKMQRFFTMIEMLETPVTLREIEF